MNEILKTTTLPTKDGTPAVPTSTPIPATPVKSEFGGPKGLEPTRYGDWEKKGKCVDF